MKKCYEIMCGEPCKQKMFIEVKEGELSITQIECNACGRKIDMKKRIIKEEVFCKVEEIFEKPQDPQLDIPFSRNVEFEPGFVEGLQAAGVLSDKVIELKDVKLLAAPEEEIQPVPAEGGNIPE